MVRPVSCSVQEAEPHLMLQQPSNDCKHLWSDTLCSRHSMPRQPLPKGALQHMFPAQQEQQQLRGLEISTEEIHTDEWCIDSADLSSIVRCCQFLTELDISDGIVKPDADLSALLQLPDSCVRLHVAGAAFSDAAAGILAQLTQLDVLTWRTAPTFTDVGLQQLTAPGLDLTWLRVFDCNTTFGTVDLHWGEHQRGSVSEQLAALCRRSPVLGTP